MKISEKEVDRIVNVVSSTLEDLNLKAQNMSLEAFEDEMIGDTIFDLMLSNREANSYFYDELYAYFEDNNYKLISDKDISNEEKLENEFDLIENQEDYEEIEYYLLSLIESCKEEDDWDGVSANHKLLSFIKDNYNKALQRGLDFYVYSDNYEICAIYDKKNDNLNIYECKLY